MKVLIYDDSFDGYLSAVYEAFYMRTNDIIIVSQFGDIPLIYKSEYISTDLAKAAKVHNAIVSQLESISLDVVHCAWLSHMRGMDTDIFRFLKLAFRLGRNICDMMADPLVCRIMGASRKVSREAHRLTGFVRFREVSGVLVADITPDCDVLPIIAQHFLSRFNSEAFVIRDSRFEKALVHIGGKSAIVPMTDFTNLFSDSKQADFEEMWRQYLQHLTIQERRNTKRMQQFMPQKYWQHMPERQAN